MGHPAPTFHDLLHDLAHELLHADARLWTSLRLLFTRPGFLTREHVAGRRASYAARPVDSSCRTARSIAAGDYFVVVVITFGLFVILAIRI